MFVFSLLLTPELPYADAGFSVQLETPPARLSARRGQGRTIEMTRAENPQLYSG